MRSPLKMAKRGNLNAGISIVIGLFVLAMIVYALTLASVNIRDATTDSSAQEIVNDSLAGIDTYSGFQTTFWVLAAVGVLFTILFSALAVMALRR